MTRSYKITKGIFIDKSIVLIEDFAADKGTASRILEFGFSD